MVRLRLMRLGRRHRPFYRLNAIDQRTRPGSKVIEAAPGGTTPRRQGEQEVELKVERIQYWLSQGGSRAETVRDMLARHEVLDAKAIEAWNKQREADKARVVAKAGEAIEAAVTELTKFAEGDADVSGFVDAAKAARGGREGRDQQERTSAPTPPRARPSRPSRTRRRPDEAAKAKKAAEPPPRPRPAAAAAEGAAETPAE
ncbi:MAG: 30S ribosomal protein S16 [Phycisphaerales bacterium]